MAAVVAVAWTNEAASVVESARRSRSRSSLSIHRRWRAGGRSSVWDGTGPPSLPACCCCSLGLASVWIASRSIGRVPVADHRAEVCCY